MKERRRKYGLYSPEKFIERKKEKGERGGEKERCLLANAASSLHSKRGYKRWREKKRGEKRLFYPSNQRLEKGGTGKQGERGKREKVKYYYYLRRLRKMKNS